MIRTDITFKDTRFYQDVKAEWREEECRSLVSLQLDRKLGKLPAKTKKTIAALDLERSESLAMALLDFNTMADLETWLKQL